MSDIHIAYLVQQFPPEVGAGPARVTEMASRWISRGARVTVVTGMPSSRVPGRAYGEGDPAYHGKFVAEEDWNGVRVLRSWLYRNRSSSMLDVIANNTSFMATSAVNALVNLGHIDVLIASAPPLFPHVSGAVVARLRQVPLVLEIRDLWPDYLVDMGALSADSWGARGLFALERRLLAAADHVVVVTESFRTRLIAKGIPAHRVDVVPNGVDLQQYYREPSSRPPLAPLVRNGPGDFLVGYLGTFGAGQDLESVVEAAVILQREDPAVRIVMAGDGPRRTAVVAAVAAAGLHNVALHPPISKHDTRAFYNSCDACLVPLAPVRVFQDTIPSKIFEVMACERPVIASLEGEGRAIVNDSGGGITAPPGDGRAIASAILRLKQTSLAEREAMGRCGRSYVESHYQRHELADRYLDVLSRVAKRES